MDFCCNYRFVVVCCDLARTDLHSRNVITSLRFVNKSEILRVAGKMHFLSRIVVSFLPSSSMDSPPQASTSATPAPPNPAAVAERARNSIPAIKSRPTTRVPFFGSAAQPEIGTSSFHQPVVQIWKLIGSDWQYERTKRIFTIFRN